MRHQKLVTLTMLFLAFGISAFFSPSGVRSRRSRRGELAPGAGWQKPWEKKLKTQYSKPVEENFPVIKTATPRGTVFLQSSPREDLSSTDMSSDASPTGGVSVRPDPLPVSRPFDGVHYKEGDGKWLPAERRPRPSRSGIMSNLHRGDGAGKLHERKRQATPLPTSPDDSLDRVLRRAPSGEWQEYGPRNKLVDRLRGDVAANTAAVEDVAPIDPKGSLFSVRRAPPIDLPLRAPRGRPSRLTRDQVPEARKRMAQQSLSNRKAREILLRPQTPLTIEELDK